MRRTCVTCFMTSLFAALVLGFAASPSSAQDNSSVTGVVTDPSGAVVAGVSVTLENLSIGLSLTKTTNAIGVYDFFNVPPASNYSLAFSKSGFTNLTLSKIVLNVGNKETRNAQLSIGGTQVTVEVTAGATETLNTIDATIGSNIDGDRIQDLPNIFVNNAATYLSLAPGVVPINDGNSSASGSTAGSVAGTRSDQTNITLDGLDVNDQRGGFAFITTVNTPLDSIQELKVTTTGDDATYGHSAGGQMELVTKSGTNNFHGQLFEYNRTTDYTANDYFNNLQGVPNPELILNQFGGDLGGPIIKNKLFFFFSYNGLREIQPQQNFDTVPVPSFFNGQLNYINASGNVETTSANAANQNSLANLDPQGIGADRSLLAFLLQRGYPAAPNTNAVGDGLNTSGLFFNSPLRTTQNTFIAKLDYQLTKNHRLFGRVTWERGTGGIGGVPLQVFPGDPDPSSSFVDHSRAWVFGDTWTISPNMTNQASFGETTQVNAFVINYKPTFPNNLSFLDPSIGSILTNPFLGQNEQFPVVPVYQGRDTFTWLRGKHTFQFGGMVSPVIFKSGNLTDVNSDAVGIGGNLNALTSGQRPSDFDPNGASDGNNSEWDRTFALILGRYSSIISGYNYDQAGNPILPQGNIPIRDYHSAQYEAFAQDSWKMRPDFTLTYGVRWQFHKPLSEVNGFEAIQNQTPEGLLAIRQKEAAEGISGPNAVPFITYRLGGSANHAPGYYKPAYDNFGPRIGMAYSPAATSGWLGDLLGDRKTSIRAGFGIDFDNNLIGQGFELDENSFLFSNSVGTPYSNLATDPRFSCASPCTPATLTTSLIPATAPGTTPRPTFTPNLDANGFPIGFFDDGFGPGGSGLYNFDPNYKTPYEMHYSFGIQREVKGGWLVEADYVGKLGRRLPALGDPAQTLNFVDATSHQSLYNAFGAVEKQVQANTPTASITAQPWFENQVGAGLAQFGLTCAQFGSCTQLAVTEAGGYFGDGDVSSLIETLADIHPTGNLEQGLLLPNVALLAQNGAAGYIGNFSASSYNALIVKVNHRMSHNLTMELNYTYSHSIDNDSGVQNSLNSFASSEICDLRNLRVCRGSSDFDHRQLLVSNFEYGLPFGRREWLGSNASKPLDELIGGWFVSGIFGAYTGSPFKIDSGAFTIDFTQTQPAVFIGTSADVQPGVHQVSQGGGASTVQFFKNPINALGAFTAPIAGGPGTRNIINGPGYWDLDLALLKNFKLPWEGQKIQFRTDAINVFNHVNFSNPGPSNTALILEPSSFGNITSDVNGPRVLQLGLRYLF